MNQILVLIEHRRNQIRDVSYEMISTARTLADKIQAEVAAVLLGDDLNNFIPQISGKVNKLLLVEDKRLENYNSVYYQKVLSNIINERKPVLTFIGHTAIGIEIAPALAYQLDIPLASNCATLDYSDDGFIAHKRTYGDKIDTELGFKPGQIFMATLQQGAKIDESQPALTAEVIKVAMPALEEIEYRKFIEYIEEAAGEVDITQADIIVSVGRGIKDEKNIGIVQELANAMGGALACSRPVVDKRWLPKERQVGTSGKTVKPRLYLAVGISGSFQHCAGMNGSSTIIAINKDPNAPIFEIAQYGIVDDLFKVVPKLTEKVKEFKLVRN